MTNNANEATFTATPWGLVLDKDFEDPYRSERESQTFAEPHTVATREVMTEQKARAVGQFKTTKVARMFQRLADEINRLNAENDPTWVARYDVGVDVTWKGDLNFRSSLKVGDNDVTRVVRIACTMKRQSAWRSTPTDHLYVQITRGRSLVRFNELKDGSFRYNDMAILIRHIVRDRRVELTADQQKAKNAAAVDRFRVGRQVSYGTIRVTASAVDAKPLAVNVAVARPMTEEEAAELYAFFESKGWL